MKMIEEEEIKKQVNRNNLHMKLLYFISFYKDCMESIEKINRCFELNPVQKISITRNILKGLDHHYLHIAKEVYDQQKECGLKQ